MGNGCANFFSKVVKFTSKMRNELNRKRNQISDFFDFYFSSYGHFCSKICRFSMNRHDNSINKNRKIYFSFDSAHKKIDKLNLSSFMKVGSKLKGGSAYS